ncbi:MAG: rhomboid family intramembrane serine protease [Candidatus Aminicenantes bacterium]|nr:rhomboid family intramembrane serine protease [Candidatus Aminicenantes bacterium]
MIIPIGHESDKVRRLPWISFFLLASCLAIFVLTSVEVSKTSKELEGTTKELINYYIQHPYLKLDSETKKLLFGEKQNEDIKKMLGVYRRREDRKVHLFKDEEQKKLDQLSLKLKNTINNVPYRKYGYIPAKKSFIGLVTYMFIHGGLLHLLGNLLLLYLTGPFIEDVWGRPIFAVFYIIAGIFSGFMFSLYYPNFTGPLIGASGAIAGLMGAFLIRYWRTKIKFFYIFFLLIRGTFKAPAWLMLPIWLAFEIFNANAIDSVNAEGGGVAHWAHIWGFLFGVVVAFGMKYLKIEEKYIHPKIEAQIHFVDEGYKASEEATQKINEGKLEEAYALLLAAARKNPRNRDLVERLWNQGKELGKEKEAAEFYIRLIEREIRRNLMDVALVHFMDLKEKVPQASLNMTCKFMFMKYLTEHKDYKEAKKLANELIEEVDLNSAPGLLQNFASAASEHSPEIAKKVIELCLQHPGIGDEQKDVLKTRLKELQSRLPETPTLSDMGEPREVVSDTEHITAKLESQLGLRPEAQSDGQHRIEIEEEQEVELDKPERSTSPNQSIITIKATPLNVKDGKIELDTDQIGQQLLPLNKVKSIAIAEIAPNKELPFVLIDLFLDDPKENVHNIRTIRLLSTSFDPTKFSPGIQDNHDALKVFISVLLKLSGATAYPDEDSIQLDSPQSFFSIEAYEKSILS